MRPGRLDRLVYVPLPDEHTREEILKLRLGSVPLADDVDIGELVKLTHRYSGAEVSIDIRPFTGWRNHICMQNLIHGWNLFIMKIISLPLHPQNDYKNAWIWLCVCFVYII